MRNMRAPYSAAELRRVTEEPKEPPKAAQTTAPSNKEALAPKAAEPKETTSRHQDIKRNKLKIKLYRELLLRPQKKIRVKLVLVVPIIYFLKASALSSFQKQSNYHHHYCYYMRFLVYL